MDLPKRKHPRLKYYDYSLPGYYYVTIHTEENTPALSVVEKARFAAADGERMPERPGIRLTQVGKIAEQQLFALQERFPTVRVDKYVIMPNHIHFIVQILEPSAGASPRPTLMDVVGAYKSLTTRAANHFQQSPGRKLFQASFYETVLRNEKAYQMCWAYIDGNPDKWAQSPEDP